MAALLQAQHPDLAGLSLRAVDGGWDNVLFRLGDGLVVRLPARVEGAALITGELDALDRLRQTLPLPVPRTVRRGQPGHGYPYPWAIMTWLPGVPASEQEPDDPVRSAEALGRFLARLHAPAHAGAPTNPYRGVPLASHLALARQRLAGLPDLPARAVLDVLEDAAAAPPHAGALRWVHGDLHGDNVLVDDGHIAGVIDFGDVHGGDPAVDAMVAWFVLPPQAHHVLRAAAPMVSDDEAWRRGRGWAVHVALAVLDRARSTGWGALERASARALTALLRTPATG